MGFVLSFASLFIMPGFINVPPRRGSWPTRRFALFTKYIIAIFVAFVFIFSSVLLYYQLWKEDNNVCANITITITNIHIFCVKFVVFEYSLAVVLYINQNRKFVKNIGWIVSKKKIIDQSLKRRRIVNTKLHSSHQRSKEP